MKYSPMDILRFVIQHECEFLFLESVTMQREGYSIAEIPDKRFVKVRDTYRMKSSVYQINVEVTDDEIVTAVMNELYVSAFISRHGESYQVHFLVHRYPISMKAQFEDNIAKEVVQYMILKTIVALRLDTPDKVCEYMGTDKSELLR